MGKIIISLSGGIDSTVLLAHCLNRGEDPLCCSFNYGSKHNKYENEAARRIAVYYKVPFNIIDLSDLVGTHFKSDLLKTGGDIPEGHYEDISMERTVVPSRNIIFISILSGIAWSHNISKVGLGIHAGDHAIYPDCRTEFLKAMDSALYLGTGKKVELYAPFVNIRKDEVVKIGIELNVPFELTRSCYKQQEISCGKCGTCVERMESFQLNGLNDPIIYEEN
jgi:7-cyano-7-deazaguanine synthase